MDKKMILEAIISLFASLGKSKDFQSFLFGTYADGEPRCLQDALSSEYLSPKQKKKIMDTKEKRKKKRKKAKKEIKLKL